MASLGCVVESLRHSWLLCFDKAGLCAQTTNWQKLPSPLPMCLPVFSILWQVRITPRSLNSHKCLLCTQPQEWHNDTIVTLPHMPPSLPCDHEVSWHISGTDVGGGNGRAYISFKITPAVLSVWRMWCHHLKLYVLTFFSLQGPLSESDSQLCSSITANHFFFLSKTLQVPSTWSILCLTIMFFTCWSHCTARREPMTSWGPWRAMAA